LARSGDAVNDSISTSAAIPAMTNYSYAFIWKNLSAPAVLGGGLFKVPFSIIGTNYDASFLADADDSGKIKAAQHRQSSGVIKYAQIASSVLVGTEHHVCVTYDSISLRIYMDGVLESTTAASAQNLGNDPSVYILSYGGSAYFEDSTLSEVAVWNAALTDGEVLSLGKRFSPLFVRPASRVLYASLLGNIFDWHGRALTTVGTTNVQHPRMIYPSHQQAVWPGAAVITMIFTKNLTDGVIFTGDTPDPPQALDDGAVFDDSVFVADAYVSLTDGVRFRERLRVHTDYLATGLHKTNPLGN
jgi:hypothetical protein